MKAKEILEKKDKELVKYIDDLKNKITKTAFEVSTKETNNHRQIRSAKKDLARALTIRRERELLAEHGEKETKK